MSLLPVSTRRRPPDRRPSETSRIEHRRADGSTSRFFVTIGYAGDDSLRPVEVFYSEGFRSGSDLEFLVCDACVLVSVALQNGLRAADMGRSMTRRELPDGSMADASLLALILRAVAEAETDAALATASTGEIEPDDGPDDEPRFRDAAE